MTARKIRELEQLVACEGLHLVSIGRTGHTHFKIHVCAPDGRKEFFVCANTPGDVRSGRNSRAILRRFARGQSTKTERNQK